jgi:hypothetical protein
MPSAIASRLKSATHALNGTLFLQLREFAGGGGVLSAIASPDIAASEKIAIGRRK